LEVVRGINCLAPHTFLSKRARSSSLKQELKIDSQRIRPGLEKKPSSLQKKFHSKNINSTE
jgi:hypothetical protein